MSDPKVEQLGNVTQETYDLEDVLDGINTRKQALWDEANKKLASLEEEYKLKEFAEKRDAIVSETQAESEKIDREWIKKQPELRRAYHRQVRVIAEITGKEIPVAHLEKMRKIEEDLAEQEKQAKAQEEALKAPKQVEETVAVDEAK